MNVIVQTSQPGVTSMTQRALKESQDFKVQKLSDYLSPPTKQNESFEEMLQDTLLEEREDDPFIGLPSGELLNKNQSSSTDVLASVTTYLKQRKNHRQPS